MNMPNFKHIRSPFEIKGLKVMSLNVLLDGGQSAHFSFKVKLPFLINKPLVGGPDGQENSEAHFTELCCIKLSMELSRC